MPLKNPGQGFRLFLALFLCLGLLSGCVARSDMEYAFGKLKTLEQQEKKMGAKLSEMEARLEKSEAAMEQEAKKIRDQSARVSVMTDTARQELRSIQGMVEETVYEMRDRVDALETGKIDVRSSFKATQARLDSIQDRLIRVEGFLGMEALPGDSEPAPSAQEPQIPDDDKAAYALAKKAFDDDKMENARTLFKAFIKNFPNSDNADNAQFWIGESYYIEKWHKKAILEYQEVIEKYPRGNKVPAALLKQGMAFDLIKDHNNARLIWTELVKKHPNSREARIAKKKLKSSDNS